MFLFNFSSALVCSAWIFRCQMIFLSEHVQRCLHLVTLMKFPERFSTMSSLNSYPWLGGYFCLNYFAFISLPQPQQKQNTASSCCERVLFVQVLRTAPRTAFSAPWELAPSNGPEIAIAYAYALHWFSIQHTKGVVVLKRHLFLERKHPKRACQTELQMLHDVNVTNFICLGIILQRQIIAPMFFFWG